MPMPCRRAWARLARVKVLPTNVDFTERVSFRESSLPFSVRTPHNVPDNFVLGAVVPHVQVVDLGT